MRKLMTVLALGASVVATAITAAPPPAEAWQIGPVIRGRNYSIGMPATMQPGPQGPRFAFPSAGEGSVHYVTLATTALAGAREITVRYRVDAERGTRFVAQETNNPGKLGFAFQRAGDNWSAKGRYEAFRWYSPDIEPLTPGVHSFTARLDDPRWVGVISSNAATNRDGYAAALADTQSVSLTFGDEAGRGHGVYATGPATFTILDFRID